MDFCMD